jgi:hypothetical protein
LRYVVVIAVFALLLFLLLLLFRKLRPYLIAGRDLVVTIRDLKNKLGQPRNSQTQSEKLTRCAACGTWVPEARMLVARSGKMFCSRECVEVRQIK